MDATLKLNDRVFSFGMLPAIEAVRVEVAVARVIGEPLFKAFMEQKPAAKAGTKKALAKDDLLNSPEVLQAGAVAMGAMMAKMDADELVTTMETVLKYVTCDGKRVEINSTFTGRNKELWQVFIYGLQFNFSDFLPDSLFASARSVGA